MNEQHDRQVGPRVDPGWWNLIREAALFVVGLVLIVYSAATPGNRIAELITGLILVGMVPVNQLLARVADRLAR